MPMRPLKTERDTICCIHWRNWPPIKAFDVNGRSGADLYRSGVIDAVELQRWQVWERDCGLLKMDESKCRTCLHVRRVEIRPPAVPCLVTMDGKTRVPIIDRTFAASLGQFRSNVMTATRKDGDPLSKRDAAWVKRAQAEESEDG